MTSNVILWKYYYERDFKTTFPTPSNFTPQHMYYIRSISSFKNTDRGKTLNNIRFHYSSHIILRNLIQRAIRIENPIKTKYTVGIWTIDFDVVCSHIFHMQRIPGYTFLEDERGLGIELAFTSNGW